jgi:hypothetical protein
MMFFSEPRSCCFDVESYIRACKYLLFASSVLRSRSLTNDEAHLVEYHRQELIKAIGTAVGKKTEEVGVR